MANPLDPIRAWHRTAADSLSLTKHVLKASLPGALLPSHVFSKLGTRDALDAIKTAKVELDRLVILAHTAAFERTLRDHLTANPHFAAPPGGALLAAVCAEVVKDIRFWNFTRVIDLFSAVDPQVRGGVKQVVDYRNWVAHGHAVALPPPSNITADIAYARLTDFLVRAGVVPP